MGVNIMDFLSQFLPLAGGLAGGAVQGIQQRQAYDQGQQQMSLATNADNRSAAASHREDVAAERAAQLFPGQMRGQQLANDTEANALDTSKWRQKQAVAEVADEDAPLAPGDPRAVAAKKGYGVDLTGQPAKRSKEFRPIPDWRASVGDRARSQYQQTVINAITSLVNKGVVSSPDEAVLMSNPKFAALKTSRVPQQQWLSHLVKEAGMAGLDMNEILNPGSGDAAAPQLPSGLKTATPGSDADKLKAIAVKQATGVELSPEDHAVLKAHGLE